VLNNVKSYREKKEFTQEQFAGLVGVSRQSIISIEKGHYIPTTVLALRIAEILEVKVEDLFILEKKDWK
jgi:putative transcriptional regulator